MGSRWYNIVVVLFWLATMTWLVTAKVLPSLLVGDPPTYESTLPVLSKDGEPVDAPAVAWTVKWNGRDIGNAASRATTGAEGATVRTVVELRGISVADFLPGLFRHIAVLTEGRQTHNLRSDTILELDAYNHLDRIRSYLGDGRGGEIIRIDGDVEQSGLSLTVNVRGFPKQTFDFELPEHALVGDELSPQARLAGLRLGQRWTVPSYSLLNYRPGQSSSPLTILHAEVEQELILVWNGEKVPVLVVVYRADPGEGIGDSNRERSRLWVRHDGTVLQQSTRLFGNEMKFVRLDEHQSEREYRRLSGDDTPRRTQDDTEEAEVDFEEAGKTDRGRPLSAGAPGP